ncbi:MAG: tyrosinase family protein, partial [bacterium]
MVGPAVIDRILASVDYESFGSTRPPNQNSTNSQWQRRVGTETELEFNPHDGVHGTLAGDMGRVPSSPRDPIFWLHHCNIDRIWSVWNGCGHQNSTNPFWKDFAFNQQFLNIDGSPWNVKVSDMFSTAALGYHYGPQPACVQVNRNLLLNFGALHDLEPRLLTQTSDTLQSFSSPKGGVVQLAVVNNTLAATSNRPISVPVTLGRNVREILKIPQLPPSGPSAPLFAAPQRVIATLIGMQPPKDTSTRVRLFVNCDYLSPRTPLSDPHYVTSISFFSSEPADMDHDGDYTVSADITAALSKVARVQDLHGDQIVVQLLPSLRGAD